MVKREYNVDDCTIHNYIYDDDDDDDDNDYNGIRARV